MLGLETSYAPFGIEIKIPIEALAMQNKTVQGQYPTYFVHVLVQINRRAGVVAFLRVPQSSFFMFRCFSGTFSRAYR